MNAQNKKRDPRFLSKERKVKTASIKDNIKKKLKDADTKECIGRKMGWKRANVGGRDEGGGKEEGAGWLRGCKTCRVQDGRSLGWEWKGMSEQEEQGQ